MAKTAKKTAKKTRKTRKARKQTAPKRATPAHRISTRRLPGKGARSRKPARAATTRGVRAIAAPETLKVTLELRDVSDRLIRDPETFFTFRRVTDRRQLGDQFALELTGTPTSFELPAATGEIVVCEVDPKRFRFAHSPVFDRTPGRPITRRAQLLREPNEWTPRFTAWKDLGAGFRDLKAVLARSPNVTLFKGTTPIAGLLVDGAYDGVAGEAITMAKTALLNTHHRLNRTTEPVSSARTWFSFVSRIVAIGRERFLAFVEPEMETLVRQIHDNIDEFRADYEPTPSANHRGNVPADLQGRITRMISIKSSHDKGNFQLTLTHLSGPDEVLLDVDIDENGTLLGHAADLFKHKITGGTHPHDIHELLVIQDGQTPGFDLGYRLV